MTMPLLHRYRGHLLCISDVSYMALENIYAASYRFISPYEILTSNVYIISEELFIAPRMANSVNSRALRRIHITVVEATIAMKIIIGN